MRQIRVLGNQSLLDIATMHCGLADMAYDIALMNGLGVDARINEGDMLSVPAVANRSVVDFYLKMGIAPATEVSIVKEQEYSLGTFDFTFDNTFY